MRLIFKDSQTTGIPLIARLAAEESIFCNVISASTQKLSETGLRQHAAGHPQRHSSTRPWTFIHDVANMQVEEVDSHVQ